MIGSVATSGQTWLVSTPGYPSSLIRSHQDVGVVSTATSAQLNAIMSLAAFQGDWWVRMRVTPGAQPPVNNIWGAWLGDDIMGPFFGLLCIYGTGTAAGQVQVSVGNLSVLDQSVNVTCVPEDVEHEFAMAFTALGGVLQAFVDDVEVLTAAGYVPDPTTSRDLQLYNETGVGQHLFPITRFELGLGSYPG